MATRSYSAISSAAVVLLNSVLALNMRSFWTLRFVRNPRYSRGSTFDQLRLASLLAFAIAAVSIVACTEVPIPTSTPVSFEPTAADPGTRALVLAGGSEIDIAALSQPRELPEGDGSRGEALYNTLGCTACHTLTDEVVVGPGFRGLYGRAGDRTSLSADEYIIQSMTKPSAFVVEGFTNSMQVFDYLTDQELADVIAFLKTIN